MGWTFTAVSFQRGGKTADVHADGNNVAWKCEECGWPVLFVYQLGRFGSSQSRATTCRGCKKTYYLSPEYGTQPEPAAGNPQAPANPMQIM